MPNHMKFILLTLKRTFTLFIAEKQSAHILNENTKICTKKKLFFSSQRYWIGLSSDTDIQLENNRTYT